MAKVFVSYSRKDIVVAKRLTAELQKCEMDFWIDWEGIPPTVDWWKEIEKGIEEADIFLFLISSDSSASKVCGQEIDTAIKNAKRIIPLVVRDIKGDEAPKQLSHLNWIFFRESDDFDAALTKLLTAIQTDYEWAATHRRLQIKALDWERNNKDSGFLLRGADLLDAEQDLAINTSKDPHPTDLQREFVYKSRKATDKQRRITTWISVAAAIALAALAAFGFYQAGLANRQTKIALSGKLAAQAEILLDKDLQKALLLGVESNRILEKNNLPIDPLARGTLLDVVNTNLQVFQFLSPGEQTKDVEFSPDGRSLASAHGSKIIFWNISSGKPINKIEMEDVLQIYSIAFHPDSRIIAAGACIEMSKNGFECQKGKIILWNIETQQQIDHLFVDHMTFENKISFSPDGKSIVSISTLALREASIVIWEMKTGEVFDVPISQETIVMEMAFSPDGNILAIGDSLWDLEKNRKMKWLGEENGFAGRVSFSPDGKLLSTTSIFPSPKTNFWDIATGELLDTFSGGVLLGSSYQMDRQFTSNSGEITVWESFWDSSNRQEVNKIPTYPGTSGLVISPDGRLIAKISDSGEILLWDTTIPQQQGNFQRVEMQDSFAFHFAFRSDSNALVSVGDGNVLEWNVSSHKGPTSKVINNDYDSVLNVSPDGKLFLSDEIDGTYIYGVRSTTTGQLVTKLQTNDQLRLDIAVLSHDNKTIATYSCVEFGDASSLCIRGEINLWNADTGARLERQIKRVFTGVTSLAFDPTDEFLAISDGNLINLWDISNDQLKVTLSAADATNISAITFSPDGNILAAIASLNIVFWDLNTRQRIGQPLLGFPTLASTFSPDGKILASLDDAGHILLWDVDLHSWVTKSCQRAGRNLTRTEWEQYMLDIRYPTDRKDATCPQWPLDGETTTIPTP